tara:strand:+ start:181 stop:303 length:123 start_codon:yes stop_codon:yes gene_type:complete
MKKDLEVVMKIDFNFPKLQVITPYINTEVRGGNPLFFWLL